MPAIKRERRETTTKDFEILIRGCLVMAPQNISQEVGGSVIRILIFGVISGNATEIG